MVNQEEIPTILEQRTDCIDSPTVPGIKTVEDYEWDRTGYNAAKWQEDAELDAEIFAECTTEDRMEYLIERYGEHLLGIDLSGPLTAEEIRFLEALRDDEAWTAAQND